jgi:hypothetical protein
MIVKQFKGFVFSWAWYSKNKDRDILSVPIRFLPFLGLRYAGNSGTLWAHKIFFDDEKFIDFLF